MDGEPKRRGRPPKPNAQSNAERQRAYRMRKKGTPLQTTDDPESALNVLRPALELVQTQNKGLLQKVATLEQQLRDTEHERDSLRIQRDHLNDEIEQFRELMKGKIGEQETEEFFRRLFDERQGGGEPWWW